MKLRIKRQPSEPFERRRLPGNDGHKVFSYYSRGSSDSQQNTGRNERAEPKPARFTWFRWRSLPSYFALLAITIAVIYALTLQTMPSVIVIDRTGTIYRPTSEYQKTISDIWGQSILNRTKITVNSQNIQLEIQASFPEITQARIELPLLGRRPSIVITTAQPVMQLVSINGAFYIDNHGKVLAKVGDVKQNQLPVLPTVGDETGLRAEPGKVVMPEAEAIFLQKLAAQLGAESIGVDSIVLPLNAANEADVRITGKPYYLKFSVLGDPRQAVGSYLAVKSKLDEQGVSPKQYIDIRVDEKVFYK